MAAWLSVCRRHNEDRTRQTSQVILVAGKEEHAILFHSSVITML